MRSLLLFLVLLFSSKCFSQPDPALFYEARIIEITGKLENLDINQDSATYNQLLWERAEMQVSLKVRELDVFKQTEDTVVSRQIIGDLSYLINENVRIGTGEHQIGKRDFLFTRGKYFSEISNYPNALADYFQIIELDVDSQFRVATLYNISTVYFAMEKIDSALFYVDLILDENAVKAKFNNSFYSCDLPSSMVNWKIEILERSMRKEELISYYKELILQNRKSGWEENAACFSERLKYLEGEK